MLSLLLDEPLPGQPVDSMDSIPRLSEVEEMHVQVRCLERGVRCLCLGECVDILGFREAAGTCWVATDKFYFYSHDIHKGFSVEYPSISMHAISRVGNEGEADQSSIYLQLDLDAIETSDGERLNVTDIIGDVHDAIYELKFYPSNEDAVDKLFLTLSECSCLHPENPGLHADFNVHDDELQLDEGAR